MKTIHSTKTGFILGVIAVFATVFLVSGFAQQEVKFVDAASYYKDAKCVVCHGQKAEKKFDSTLTDEQLLEIVLKGKKAEKPPHMPAYEPKGVNAEQAKALVDHMKQLKSAQ